MFKKDNQQLAFLWTIVKQAFEINRTPFSWHKAILAGICSGLPVIIGVLLGQLPLGLLGAIGSYSYFYVSNEPYAVRAKKIFFVVIGISFCVGLGTVVAPYPVLIVIVVGLIGAIATFIFGVLKIQGAAAMFFVLSFLMATSMPIHPSAALTRVAFVFSSGFFAWVVSMAGFFLNPRRAEIEAIKGVYAALAVFSESIGKKNMNDVRNRTVGILKAAQETIVAGSVLWRKSSRFNRLVVLNEQANNLFLEMLGLSCNTNRELPQQLPQMIKKLSMGIELKDEGKVQITLPTEKLDEQYDKLLERIYYIQETMNTPLVSIQFKTKLIRSSLRMKYKQSFSKDSIVFVNAVRYGIVLSISTIVAFAFTFNKPYWIPMSCAAVMLGSTIMSTLYRAIQRSCGTFVGVIIAAIILQLRPQSFMIGIINICLVSLTYLFITKNYALATIFLTPSALLLAETAAPTHNISYFATARIIDTVIGSMIGLIGTYVISRHSASSRLPDLMVKLIRNQSQLLAELSSPQKRNNNIKALEETMQINLTNVKMAYTAAQGEIPNNQEMLDMLWPALFSLEHMSYLLNQLCTKEKKLNLATEDIEQLLSVFETIAIAIEQKQTVQPTKIPIMNQIPKICHEINILQEALSMKSIVL